MMRRILRFLLIAAIAILSIPGLFIALAYYLNATSTTTPTTTPGSTPKSTPSGWNLPDIKLPSLPSVTLPWQKCDGKTEVEVTLTESLASPSSQGCAKGRWWVVRGEVEITEKNNKVSIVTKSPPEGLDVVFWRAKPGTGLATIKVVYSN